MLKVRLTLMLKHIVIAGLVGLIFTLALPSVSRAIPFTVDEGWDLFNTVSAQINVGTIADPVYIEFEGVNLGVVEFDPDGILGNGDEIVADTGNTDTIVQRLEQAEAEGGQTDVIDIEIVALQLKSVAPIDLGVGLDYHYATLQTGIASTGTAAITFDDESTLLVNENTFDSDFTVHFDLRIGALDGTIVGDGSKHFTSNDAPWGREAIGGAVLIEGVNYLLNGADTTHDFHSQVITTHDAGDGSQHVVEPATPEPSTLLLLGFGLAGLIGFGIRRKRLSKKG
jgi:hypothetical protein